MDIGSLCIQLYRFTNKTKQNFELIYRQSIYIYIEAVLLANCTSIISPTWGIAVGRWGGGQCFVFRNDDQYPPPFPPPPPHLNTYTFHNTLIPAGVAFVYSVVMVNINVKWKTLVAEFFYYIPQHKCKKQNR